MFNRNFALILAGNIILGSAMPMLIILGGLTGAWLAPGSWLATAPPSAQMIAGIIFATPASLFMGRFGRKAGFILGAFLTISGGLMAMAAIELQSFLILCLAHFLLGCALICVNYFRFAASEAVTKNNQARAISFTLASGLVAALLGPELFSYTKDFFAPTPLSGAYGSIVLLGLLGIIPILGLRLSSAANQKAGQQKADFRSAIKTNPQIINAIGITALSQAMMVMLMTPTPLAMIDCGFVDDQAADVIKWHVIAMFAPGFFTGSLIQRFGTERIAYTGIALLVISAIFGATGLNLINFYISLILLGLGWNFGFIGGTNLLQSTIKEQQKSVIQGANDTILAIASSLASLLSGIFYAGLGWIGLTILSIPVMIFALVLLRLLLGKREKLAH